MALIKCPECENEVSDKAEKCIHCGYPIKNELKEEFIKMYVNDKGKAFNRERWIFTIEDINCKITSDIAKEGEKILLLDEEKNKIKECTINSRFYHNDRIENKNFLSIGIDNIEDEIVSQVQYIGVKSKEKINVNTATSVKCPICGSTQIQLVNRKWSIWTGILTNKVDRVCMNCKHKF